MAPIYSFGSRKLSKRPRASRRANPVRGGSRKFVPSSRSSGSGSSNMQDVIAAGVSFALNQIVPGSGHALSGARAIKRFRDASQAGAAAKRRTGRLPKTSKYSGKMKRAKKNSYDPFIKYGFRHNTEITGQVTDIDCVYVGHSCTPPYNVIEITAQSLIRKLFEKAGVIVNSVNDALYNLSTNGTVGWKIRINRIDGYTGTITGYDYETVSGQSCATICGQESVSTAPTFTAYMDVLQQYAMGKEGKEALNVLEPMSLVLFTDVNPGGTATYVQVASLNLREEHVIFSSVSSIKIQNRSLSYSGETSADSVTNNPLRMVKYKFNNVPRQRDKTTMMQLPVARTGVLTLGAANGANPYMKEPVSPKLFWNCHSSSSTNLNPGEMKSDTISFKKSMKLLHFLKYIGCFTSDDKDSGAGTKYVTNDMKGPFALYALEDQINVNSSEEIAIAYEVNRSLAVYTTTKKVRFASGAVYSITQNDIGVAP